MKHLVVKDNTKRCCHSNEASVSDINKYFVESKVRVCNNLLRGFILFTSMSYRDLRSKWIL